MPKFDLEEAINELEYSTMLKKGMLFYFTAYNVKINSKKEFDKAVEDYLKLNVGE